MMQTEEVNIKLEIKGYQRFRAGIFIDIFGFVSVLTLLLVVCFELIRSQTLLPIPYVALTALYFCLLVLFVRSLRRVVIRLEAVDGRFYVTRISGEILLFHPDKVCQVQEGYTHILLVLENGQKLDFWKTDRLSFFGHFNLRDDHIWIPFFSSQTFPNATHKILRFPR